MEDHPFNRRQLDRYDKYAVNYYTKDNYDWEDDLADEGVNSVLFKTIANKKRRDLGR